MSIKTTIHILQKTPFVNGICKNIPEILHKTSSSCPPVADIASRAKPEGSGQQNPTSRALRESHFAPSVQAFLRKSLGRFCTHLYLSGIRNPSVGRSHDSADPLPISTRHRRKQPGLHQKPSPGGEGGPPKAGRMRWKGCVFADAMLERTTPAPHTSSVGSADSFSSRRSHCACGAGLRSGFRNPMSFIEIGMKSIVGRLGHDPALQNPPS